MGILCQVGNTSVWANRFVEQYYTPDFLGRIFITNTFSSEGLILQRASEFEIAAFGLVSEELGQQIARHSASDFDCYSLAKSLFFDAAERGWPLPKSLLTVAKDIISCKKSPRKQGSRYWKIRTRNQVGAMALLVLTDPTGFGLDATRNPATDARGCGCDVLAEATAGRHWASITYEGAAGIWRSRKRLIAEFHCNMCLRGESPFGNSIDRAQALQLLGILSMFPSASGRKPKI